MEYCYRLLTPLQVYTTDHTCESESVQQIASHEKVSDRGRGWSHGSGCSQSQYETGQGGQSSHGGHGAHLGEGARRVGADLGGEETLEAEGW